MQSEDCSLVGCDAVSMFWYLTDVSGDVSASVLRVNQLRETLFLDCLVQKLKEAQRFEASGSNSPATQRRFQVVVVVMSAKRLVMLPYLICYEEIGGVTETSV
jgi:hypothetical protein